jgi:predicted GNAT family acetyltransferase
MARIYKRDSRGRFAGGGGSSGGSGGGSKNSTSKKAAPKLKAKAGTVKTATKRKTKPAASKKAAADVTVKNRVAAYADPYSPQALSKKAKRQAQVEHAAEVLASGRFAIKPGDSSRIRLGKATAIDAVRDARNPAVGLLSAQNKKGEATGFLSYKAGRSKIEIMHIGTDQSQKGTGRALFQQALNVAAKNNKGLIVSATDDAAAFYRKMGMRDLGNGSDFALTAAQVKRRAGR